MGLPLFVRLLVLTGAALSPITTIAQPQAPARSYYKELVPLRLDATRVAIKRDDPHRSAFKAADYSLHGDAWQLPLDQWTLLTCDAEVANIDTVNLGIELALAQPAVTFVSPVFLDEFAAPLIVTQDLLIGIRADVAIDDARKLVARYGQIVQEGLAGLPNGFKVRSTSRNGLEVLEQSTELAAMPEVLFAEPDMIVSTRDALIPNDPFFPELWGLRNTGQFGGVAGFDMGATTAWDTTIGNDSIITVVMDGGVQSTHPDLAGRIITPGFDATGQGGLGDPIGECDRHGTAVAGCIVASIHNSEGVVGIAPGTRVASARTHIPNGPPCTGSNTGQISWVIDALAWAQSLGARITNYSIGLGAPSAALEAAYQTTYDAGLMHFASSMNNGIATVGYPARLPVVNGIGAIDSDGHRSAFSNYGENLDYCAPGSWVVTTDRTGPVGYDANDYAIVDGTSFASPYAAGVAALILSHDPSLSPAHVESILRYSARDLGATNYDFEHGHGLVQADDALAGLIDACPDVWEPRYDHAGPTARVGFGFVYDSARQVHILFGGDAGGTYSNQTWVWNGSFWRLAAITGPSPRANCVMTFDSARNVVVLFGGRGANSSYLNDTWEWDGQTWIQREFITNPPSRGTAAMVFDSGRNKSVLFGGFGSEGHLGDFWEFDGLLWVQRFMGFGPGPREWAGMSYDSVRGRIVLQGGFGPGNVAHPETWEWHIATGHWSLVASNGPGVRASRSMAYDATRGVTVLFSGRGDAPFMSDHWEWDGLTWTRRNIALPEARVSHSVSFDSARSRVLMYGGEGELGGQRQDLWEYDGDRWLPLGGPSPTARFGAETAFSSRLGSAVMLGGYRGPGDTVAETWLRTNTAWGRLSAPTNGMPPRAFSSVVTASAEYGGETWIHGGISGASTLRNDTWRLHFGQWSQLNTAFNGPPRYDAASCFYESVGRFIVFGGVGASGVLADAQSLITCCSSTWEPMGGSLPPPRSGASMAYDPVRDEALLHGGVSSSGIPLDDTWRLKYVDGLPIWTLVGNLGNLQAWGSTSMVWNPARQRLVLFGKDQAGFEPPVTVFHRTWEWDGINWVETDIYDAHRPPFREHQAVMATTIDGNLHLFGGRDPITLQPLGDTYEFHGPLGPNIYTTIQGGGTYDCGEEVLLSLPSVSGLGVEFQWHRGGAALADGPTTHGSVVAGAQTPRLTVSHAREPDAGAYSCVLTNVCETERTMGVGGQVLINNCCTVDFDLDYLVAVPDIFAFLSAWFALDPRADFDNNTIIQVPDIFAFLSAWFTGC